MKKLIILFVLIGMIACTGKEPITKSTLSGTVENLGDGVLLMTQGRDIDTIMVNEDGTFSITKDLEKGSDFRLGVGRSFSSIYLAPGYDLSASFNAEDPGGTIAFEGGLALENNYNLKYAELNKELSGNMMELYSGEAAPYKEAMLNMRTAKEEMLTNYVEENPDICEEFVANQEVLIEFLYYSSLSNYEPAHKYYAKVEEVELPEGWNAYEAEIDVNNSAYLDVPVAMSVVGGIINKRIEAAGGPSEEDAWGTAALLESQFDWILANVENQDMINYFLNSTISSIVDYAGTSGIEKQVAVFYEKSSDQKAIEDLKEKEAMWAPLMPGEPAFGFTLPDINGEMVSLDDFKGKYVYIDFWATWCGPCKIEIPVLEEMAVTYADKNIKIISISVDADKQAWIDMVTEDKPEWLQLHDAINMNDDYLVKFIPTFVLIDRDGKFINARAPRPSSGEELENLLMSLEGI